MVITTKPEGDNIALFFDNCRLGSINATHKYFCCGETASLSYSILKDISNLLRSAQATTFQSRILFPRTEKGFTVCKNFQNIGVINLAKKTFLTRSYISFYLCDIEIIMNFMKSDSKIDWKRAGF